MSKERLANRKKVAFSVAEAERLAREAAMAGMTEAKYMRQAVLACWGAAPKPTRKPGMRRREAIQELNRIGFQLKKLGVNVNQLAHQANAGLVPVSRGEVQYLVNQQQVVLAMAAAAIEALLA